MAHFPWIQLCKYAQTDSFGSWNASYYRLLWTGRGTVLQIGLWITLILCFVPSHICACVTIDVCGTHCRNVVYAIWNINSTVSNTTTVHWTSVIGAWMHKKWLHMRISAFHWPKYRCLFNSLFKLTAKNTSKLRITGLKRRHPSTSNNPWIPSTGGTYAYIMMSQWDQCQWPFLDRRPAKKAVRAFI